METSPNIYTRPMAKIKKAAAFIFDRFTTEPEPYHSDHWKPSAQRDVGKTPEEARSVQLVLEGMMGTTTISPEVMERLNRPDDVV